MSYATQVFYMAGIQAFAGLAYYSPLKAASIPVLLSPTFFAIWRYHSLPREEASSSKVATWTYLGTGVLGLPAAELLQLGLCSLMFKALFGPQASDYLEEGKRITLENVPTEIILARQQMEWAPGYFLGLMMFSYIGSALLEEAIKYFALRLAIRHSRPWHEHEHLIYAALAGLGFGTIENTLVTYASITGDGITGWSHLACSSEPFLHLWDTRSWLS